MKVGIVGTGIAGLSAAISALENNDEVILFTKESSIDDSASSWAQGGIVHRGENDTPEKLFRDIVSASGGLVRKDLAKQFSQEAPKTLEHFINLAKIPFQQDSDKKYSYTKEGGHKVKRILYNQDKTGKVIIAYLKKFLIDKFLKDPAEKIKKRLKILTNHMVIDLINLPHHSMDPLSVYEKVQCLGVYAYETKRRTKEGETKQAQVKTFFFDKVILATGGIGRIYLHNTNPPSANGDGIALAYRSGARVVNMEFTQFHPTTLAHKKGNNFLISEALRGERAILVNSRGEEFLKKYHRSASLAPRDIVSRAIFIEQIKQKDQSIYLCLKKMKGDFSKRFPKIYNKCKELSIPFEKEGIPVTPAFHFSCGGILTNENGETNIPNLFAVGENACTGLHGANRLASTSLLEGLYFGYKAGQYRDVKSVNYPKAKIKPWIFNQKIKEPDHLFIRQNFLHLQNLMWNFVGIIRNKKNLKIALSELTEIKKKIEFKYHNGYFNKEFLELRNSIQVGVIIANSAIKNPTSLGCHFIEN